MLGERRNGGEGHCRLRVREKTKVGNTREIIAVQQQGPVKSREYTFSVRPDSCVRTRPRRPTAGEKENQEDDPKVDTEGVQTAKEVLSVKIEVIEH